jgi:hypothetical protein
VDHAYAGAAHHLGLGRLQRRTRRLGVPGGDRLLDLRALFTAVRRSIWRARFLDDGVLAMSVRSGPVWSLQKSRRRP